MGRSFEQSLTLCLERALAQHTAGIHHYNQGVQYATNAYTARLREVNVQISMTEVGAAWHNGYAEWLIRRVKEEKVDFSNYTDYADAVRYVGRFLDEGYMLKHIYSPLGYLTPAEFE